MPDDTPESAKAQGLARVSRLTKRATDSLAERDEMIVSLYANGNATPTEIGRAASLTRGRVHQIIQREKSKA